MESHRWGDYEITEVLGKGGMGIVYKGRQISLDRPVAIKVLPNSLTSRKDFVDRFYREAKSVAKLNCPQIIQVYGAGESQGKHYFAMEFIEGEDLGEKLKRGLKFEVPNILHIIKETAMALAAAGEKNIIHRDIKPANIMMTRKGEIKVMDFGLAKVTSDNDAELTQAGVVMGTVNYLSPEQGQGKNCDQRTDIYSLGIVMYELLVGQVPFQGDNPSAIIYQHIHATPPPPSRFKPDIPKDVEAIVLKCLMKDPNERYFSARELARDIASVESGGAPKTAMMDMKTLRYKKARKKWAIITVILLIIAGLGIGGYFAYPDYIKPYLDKLNAEPGTDGPVVDEEAEKLRQEELAKQKAEEERLRREEEERRRQEEEERRQQAELLKKIDTELTTIEEGIKTNNPDELISLKERLLVLGTSYPDNQRIPVLTAAVDNKIVKLQKREEGILTIEKHLAAQEFAQAEQAAIVLVQEDPDDIIVKTLYTRVLKEKEAWEKQADTQARINKGLTDAQALVDLEKYDMALVKYQEVLSVDPANAPAIAGIGLCEEKIAADKQAAAEAAAEAAHETNETKAEAGLSGKEQIAYMQCFSFYNTADEAFTRKDYDLAMSNLKKCLAVEGIDHIAEAIEVKKNAVELKTKIEAILDAMAREQDRKERVKQLTADVDFRASKGNEAGAIEALEELLNVDPQNSSAYNARLDELHMTKEKKASSQTLVRFHHYISKGELAKLLETIDQESTAFYRWQEESFTEFLNTFTDISSEFTIEEVHLSESRDTCSIKGAWGLSFLYAPENVKTNVTYSADFRLVRKNGLWKITGANTTRKEL